MKISIITVVYNNPQVGEALDSIFAQRLDSGDELESIVIDGGSTDGTLAVLETYRSRLAVFISEKDRGIYDAMNKGLELASGDVVGMLNSDDLYAHEKVLGRVLESLRNGEVDVCYGDLVYVQKEALDRVVRYWKSEPFHSDLFNLGWAPPHPTFFVRRELYRRFGKFNLEFKVAADFELMLRFLLRHGARWIYIPEVLVRMRLGGHSNQSLKNISRGNQECYAAFRINKLPVPKLYFLFRMSRRIFQFLGSWKTKRILGNRPR